MPNDTLEIECIIDSIRYSNAKASHDKARDNYDGHSWGYHGYYFIEKVDKAAQVVKDRLEEYINSKVEEILIKKGIL
jgi:hypothetical protein